MLLDGANCDATHGAWTVRSIQSGRSLVLFSSRTLDGREVDPRVQPKPRLFFDCSWAFVLVPEGEGATRLLVRSRLRMVPGWALRGAGFLRVGDTVVQRAMLRGIKRRAEQAANQQAPAPAGAVTGAGTQRGGSRR